MNKNKQLCSSCKHLNDFKPTYEWAEDIETHECLETGEKFKISACDFKTECHMYNNVVEPMDIKYEYATYIWGQIFNNEFIDKHEYKEKSYVFDTLEERSEFLEDLRKKSKELNAVVVTHEVEGYDIRKRITILHRVSEYKGAKTHTKYELCFSGHTFEEAVYFLNHKWYPGCNDYPFGTAIDYEEDSDFKILDEWVEGHLSLGDEG